MQNIYMSDELKKKMLESLEEEEIAVPYKGDTYLLFNQIKIEIDEGKYRITFRKDGLSVGYIETKNATYGDTIFLEGVTGFIKGEFL